MQKIQKRKVCRYYARGKCVKEDCPFVHQAQTKKPCKFWTQTGHCRKGKNCQFYHQTREEQKKDKKFIEKNKFQQQGRTQRNITESQKQQNMDKKKMIKEQEQIKPQKNQQKKDKAEQAIDELLGLKLNQQIYKQLTKGEGQGQQKLQFFKQYPKTFPDYSKTAEVKQHIKKVQQRFFKNRPFLEILKQLPSKQQQQYYQIIRRYQDSFQLQDESQPRIYFINLRPLLFNKEINLHFTLEQNYIQLKINQRQYPQVKARFEMLNQSIPNAYKHKFVDLLQKYHSKHNLFDTLKFFQNSFQKNYETVKFKLQNQHFKKVQLKQKIQSQKQRINKVEQKGRQEQQKLHHTKKHNNHNEHNKIHGHKDEQQEQQEQVDKKRCKKKQPRQQRIYVNPPPIKPVVVQDPHFVKSPLQKQKPKKQFRDYYQLQFNRHENPQHQNLNDQITVDSLVMLNCPYLVVEKMLLYIQCNCSKVLMYLFDAEERKQLKLWVKLKCKKCNDCIRIVWQRQVIHNKGQLISRMSFVNGKLIDIGGVGWKVGCNCDQEILKNKLYLPGERLQLNCHSCFSNMNIIFNGIKNFNPFVKEFQMQQDKQLPLKGGCNHDKYDFRWMRYSCCGRPFACDQCHDFGSIKQHEIHQGITMICGYCASEQTTASQCAKCKKQLIKGHDKAGHWEGGMGCRDQNLLSKKDGKKYAGMGKVQSTNKKKKEK